MPKTPIRPRRKPFHGRLAATRCRSMFGSFGGVCFCAPTRTSDGGARRPFASVENHFISHRVPSAGRVGAYCIRPFKWPRRGQIQRRRVPVGRYCSLPGTSGAYAFAPLHGRPTMAAVVRSPPECFPIRAPDAHSPPSETISRATASHPPVG